MMMAIDMDAGISNRESGIGNPNIGNRGFGESIAEIPDFRFQVFVFAPMLY
jgi:hypothetical protein